MARIEKADFMSCVRIGNVIMCGSKVYKYKGYFFEWHSFCGPSPLRKDGELSKKIPKGFHEHGLMTEVYDGIVRRFERQN